MEDHEDESIMKWFKNVYTDEIIQQQQHQPQKPGDDSDDDAQATAATTGVDQVSALRATLCSIEFTGFDCETVYEAEAVKAAAAAAKAAEEAQQDETGGGGEIKLTDDWPGEGEVTPTPSKDEL